MSTTVQTTGTGSVYIQNLGFTGNSIIATNENGSVNFVPNGTGVIGFGDVGFNNGAISTTLDNLDLVLSPNGTGVVKTDNLQLDGNTISTTNVDGDLLLAPNGTGAVLTGNLQLAGNTLSTTDVDGDLVLAPNGTGTVKTDNLQLDGNTISTTDVDGDLVLAPNGTGTVKTGNLQLDGNTISTTNVDGNLVLAPNGTGNVGLGTSSPGASLEVYKDFNGQSSGSTSAIFGGVDSGISWSGVKILEKGSGLLSLDTKLFDVVVDSSSKFVVTGTGSVGIGTTTPTCPLQITGAGGVLTMEGTGSGSHCYIQYHNDGLTNSRNGWIGYGNDGSLDLSISNETASGNLLLITPNNVGIGTTSPTSKLTISSGSTSHQGNETSYHGLSITTGSNYQTIMLGYDGTYDVGYINCSKGASLRPLCLQTRGHNVGIGTTDTNAKLHVLGGGTSTNTLAYAQYYKIHGSGGAYQGYASQNMWECSIYGSARIISSWDIVAHNSAAYSDSRIKKDITDIDDSSALDVIRLIKPKKYSYVDVVRKSDKPVWGFIAQEVSSVLDYAVEKMQKAIPNVYKIASVSEDGFLLTFDEPIALEAMDNIRLQLKTFVSEEHDVNVMEVISSTSVRLSVPLSEEHHTGIVDDQNIIRKVFVYGQWVDDFHILKKEAIFTVAVAALQEVDRRQVADNERILELEGEVSLLKEENNLLKQQLASIASRLSAAGL